VYHVRVRTLAGLLFIAAAAGVALLLALRGTVAVGRVIAADILAAKGGGVANVGCDPRIPIGRDGAVFHCTLENKDGSTSTLEVTMNRKGELAARLVGTTEPVHRGGPSGDPWDE
jgi:hypothetical protein